MKNFRIDYKKPLKLHIGCGDKHLSGFINCDIRETKATDKAFNCSELKPFRAGCAELIFSHASFEHIEYKKQEKFFNECSRVLSDSGIMIILGIPDFEQIAKAYLEEKTVRKNSDDIFNLYEAYRLTHGDAEDETGLRVWQLHKALFDKYNLEVLADITGFNSQIIFNYAYKGELLKTNLALICGKQIELRLSYAKGILSQFSEYFDDLERDFPKTWI